MAFDGSYYGHGIALKTEHGRPFVESRPAVDWVEVITERFLRARGGPRLEFLEAVRREVPVALHGTMLSIGSVDPLGDTYLHDLKALADCVQPAWISDHLAWSSFDGSELDLMPLPYTEEALAHVVRRVSLVQEALGRRILLENPSTYVAFCGSTLTEWEFLGEVARRADCGILLDVNNVYVSARNHGFDARRYLAGLPGDRVAQVHLAGHLDTGSVVVDTHEGPVPACVWDLYREALRLFGPLSTIVEWDTAVPPLEVLVAESHAAARIAREECYGAH